MKKELLRMDHITLSVGGEKLLDNLNFQMYSGEIMGLLAKEAKGCDRLIQLIRRNTAIDFGTVWYAGRVVNRYSYSDNLENKVYVIESRSHLVSALSIADNIFVLRKGFKKYLINEDILVTQTKRHLEELGIELDITKTVRELTELERCKAELAKAMLIGCGLIIVDTPANILSQHELQEFQEILKNIRQSGTSILYVANHHQEVFKIVDRAALYAGGQIKKIFEHNELTDGAIAGFIRQCYGSLPKVEAEGDDGVLHFHHVYSEHLRGLDFVLHKGECLTLYDMDNQIAEDILNLMEGREEASAGRITLSHEPYGRRTAEDYLDHRIAIIPQDSTKKLLFYDRSFMENLTFLLDRKLRRSLISSNVYRSIRSEYRERVGDIIDEKDIRRLDLSERLSLVYYRMHLFHPKLLICIQPMARGDMFCRMHVMDLIRDIQKLGTAVLILTPNISDTLSVSDRLMTIEDGMCVAEYDKDNFERLST